MRAAADPHTESPRDPEVDAPSQMRPIEHRLARDRIRSRPERSSPTSNFISADEVRRANCTESAITIYTATGFREDLIRGVAANIFRQAPIRTDSVR
jgi:hypothetical protein